MTKPALALDEVLTPLDCTCVQCGELAKIYPVPVPEGSCVCLECSPSWLESFVVHLTNKERAKHGLELLVVGEKKEELEEAAIPA